MLPGDYSQRRDRAQALLDLSRFKYRKLSADSIRHRTNN